MKQQTVNGDSGKISIMQKCFSNHRTQYSRHLGQKQLQSRIA